MNKIIIESSESNWEVKEQYKSKEAAEEMVEFLKMFYSPNDHTFKIVPVA